MRPITEMGPNCKYSQVMVLILVGNSEIGAHMDVLNRQFDLIKAWVSGKWVSELRH